MVNSLMQVLLSESQGLLQHMVNNLQIANHFEGEYIHIFFISYFITTCDSEYIQASIHPAGAFQCVVP